mmetsp:Transcript_24769/g.38895  ORF Transcript_24769/g.38895 Transcript_24769/m.38895 type:complete len:245 (+) Transcript_24769:344-1078(+)
MIVPRYDAEKRGPRPMAWPYATSSAGARVLAPTAPLLPATSPRKVPIHGYAGHVPGYISGNLYGETWKSLVVKNEDQKEHPKVNWQSSGYRTSKVESDRHKDDYMKELWAAEQAEDSQWNLHKLNRCRDPTVLPPSYAGYIPYVKSENLIGASSGRTLLAASKCKDPMLQVHLNPLLFSEFKEQLYDTSGKKGVGLKAPVSNDATGRAPATLGEGIGVETPWVLQKTDDWGHSTNLLNGLLTPR